VSTWKRRRSGWGAEATEQEYWLSYSDLMAGLLMIFALMLFAALHHYGGIINKAGEVAGRKMQIIARLDSIMNIQGGGVIVDPTTGAVQFPDGVLFAQGQAVIQQGGKTQLNSFAERYFEVLLGDPEVRQELKSIVIEGHTNDDASYMYNLDLSQRRAFAVMQHFLTNAPGYSDPLKEYVTASGRSYSQPICATDGLVHSFPCPVGPVDKVKSRRIEILFRLKDEEALHEVRELLRVR
jgi:chemotaxis protein MotB